MRANSDDGHFEDVHVTWVNSISERMNDSMPHSCQFIFFMTNESIYDLPFSYEGFLKDDRNWEGKKIFLCSQNAMAEKLSLKEYLPR